MQEFLISSNPFLPIYVAGFLFFLGLLGFVIRKNILSLLMSLEIMLNAINLNILSLSKIYGWEEGPLFIFFVMTLAATAAGVGLALAVRIYKIFNTISITCLKGSGD